MEWRDMVQIHGTVIVLNSNKVMRSKNYVLMLLFSLVTLAKANAQDSSTNLKSIGQFKLGALGGWIAYEQPLANKWLIHAEFGQEFGFFGGANYDGFEFVATNTLSLEPRFYYSRAKRKRFKKSLLNNSGNYVAIEIQHVPNWMTFSSDDNVTISPSTSFMPKIGMRRTIGPAITFELAGGVGYTFNSEVDNTIAVGLDLKLGFLFLRF